MEGFFFWVWSRSLRVCSSPGPKNRIHEMVVLGAKQFLRYTRDYWYRETNSYSPFENLKVCNCLDLSPALNQCHSFLLVSQLNIKIFIEITLRSYEWWEWYGRNNPINKVNCFPVIPVYSSMTSSVLFTAAQIWDVS